MASKALEFHTSIPRTRTRCAGAPPLLLVDGSNLLFRAAYGFPRRVRSRGGEDITPVFGFLALLRKAMHESGLYAECVVLFDGQTSWNARLEAEPQYKWRRAATMSPERHALVSRAFELFGRLTQGLELLRIRWAEVAGHEADDALAARASRRREVVIMSPDRDFYQLLSERVRVMNTLRTPDRWFVEAGEIVGRYGVWPHQWADFRALMGDPSDAVPGVRGVGPVRASRFLAGGLPLRELPASGRLTGAFGEKVLATWGDVLHWREILELRRDVRAGVRLTGRRTPEPPKAADVCESLGLW